MTSLTRRLKGLERNCAGFVPPLRGMTPRQMTDAQLIWLMTEGERTEMSHEELRDWFLSHGMPDEAAELERIERKGFACD